MAYEHVSDNGMDPTDAAIRLVLTTLDGESLPETGSPAYADDRPPQEPDGNQQLEGELVQAGIFKTRGALQRQVLGCVGCQLEGASGDWRGVRTQKISGCTGGSVQSVRRILGELRDNDLLESQKFGDHGTRGQRPEWFRATPAWEAFSRRPQAPQVCGPQARKQQPNTHAEQLLLDEGVLGWRGNVTKVILGCIACRLRAGEDGAYGKGVSDCQGILSGSTNAALRNLHEAGVLDATEQRQPEGKGGRSRIVYKPSQTPAGQALAALIEAPGVCGLATKDIQEKGPTAA